MPEDNDDVLTLNIEDLKVSEIEEIEELSGASLDELFAEGKPRGKALRIIGCVLKRRTDPSFTMEQAGDLVIKLAETNGNGAGPLENDS